MIDDLDLVRPGAEARQRVDEALQTVVGLDDLFRRALLERVRLVVDHQCPRAVELEHVEPALQQHTVVHEGERPLGGRAGQRGDAAREPRLAVRRHEAGDALQLVVRHARIPATHVRG